MNLYIPMPQYKIFFYRYISIISLIVALFGCGMSTAMTPTQGIGSIQTDNYANTKLDYYYYIPSSIIKNKQSSYPVFVAIPSLSGRGEQFVSKELKDFAESENMLIISPSFVWDQKNWSSQRSYQYPKVWSGDALITIIEQVKREYDIDISGLYLFGFSAGAQFALRFSLWKPEMCIACAVHGSGGTIMPREKNNVRFFVTVGKQDTSRIAKSKNFFKAAKYFGIDVAYREYDIGHRLSTEQVRDSLRFFKQK